MRRLIVAVSHLVAFNTHHIASCALRHALRILSCQLAIIRTRRPKCLGCVMDEHLPHLCHRAGLLSGEQMAVGVHRQGDGGMPHHRLNRFGVCPRHREPRAAGVPQGVEIHPVAGFVHIGQKVPLFSPLAPRSPRASPG